MNERSYAALKLLHAAKHEQCPSCGEQHDGWVAPHPDCAAEAEPILAALEKDGLVERHKKGNESWWRITEAGSRRMSN